MPRHLLVVVTAPHPEDELLDRLRSGTGEDVELLVVAPASDLSFLEWLSGEEAAAREEAERRARKAAEVGSLAARVVDERVGDPDPLTAIEDALRTFPADEVIIVTRPNEVATWLEKDAAKAALEQLGRPVTHIVDDDVEHAVTAHAKKPRKEAGLPGIGEEVAREIVRARSPWVLQRMVFVVVAGVAAVVIALVVVLSRILG